MNKPTSISDMDKTYLLFLATNVFASFFSISLFDNRSGKEKKHPRQTAFGDLDVIGNTHMNERGVNHYFDNRRDTSGITASDFDGFEFGEAAFDFVKRVSPALEKVWDAIHGLISSTEGGDDMHSVRFDALVFRNIDKEKKTLPTEYRFKIHIGSDPFSVVYDSTEDKVTLDKAGRVAATFRPEESKSVLDNYFDSMAVNKVSIEDII